MTGAATRSAGHRRLAWSAVPPAKHPRPVRVTPKPLGDLLRLLPGATGDVDPALRVTGCTHDSREVRPGDLYLGLPGSRTHGAGYAGQAAAAGAVAGLTDPAGWPALRRGGLPAIVVRAPRSVAGLVAGWVYGRPAAGLTLLGITGTNGKTTTAYLVESALRAAGHRTGLIGTVETRIGDTSLPSVRTTPEATDLQALFAVMRERGVTAVAMEVSSHALALDRVAGTRFSVGVFTNFSQDHLDFHGDLAAYLAAKARLFEPGLAAHGVINADDPAGARLAGTVSIPVTTVSPAGRPADWRAGRLRAADGGTRLTVVGPDRAELDLRVQLPGAFNAANALLALVAATATGVPAATAARGIAGLRRVPGRMERIEAGQPFLALVDYAHTPEAVSTLLGALRAQGTGRVLVVLGCGGDRDRAKRPLMGAAAARGADLAVLTSDNPRSEDPAAILAELAAGAYAVPPETRAEVVIEESRAAAIEVAVAWARPGDVLVVAGKGHEQGQEYAGRTLPFDDRVVLAEALRRVGGAE